MPVYTYRCENCGVQFEKSQKFTDKPLTRCPECRKGKVRRIVQPSAIVFKGTGWYATDSRKSSERHLSKSSTTSASGDKSEKPASTEKSASTGASDKAEAKPAKAAPSSTE